MGDGGSFEHNISEDHHIKQFTLSKKGEGVQGLDTSPSGSSVPSVSSNNPNEDLNPKPGMFEAKGSVNVGFKRGESVESEKSFVPSESAFSLNSGYYLPTRDDETEI
jgi:hypothetical protein